MIWKIRYFLEENQELVIEGIKESMDDCTILSKSIQKMEILKVLGTLIRENYRA